MLTAPEAAVRLGCSVQYVRRLLRSSKLHGRKMGRDWLLEESEIEQLVAIRGAVPLFESRLTDRGRNRATAAEGWRR